MSTFRERGNDHLASGEWAEAVLCYKEAAAADPGDARIHIGVGFALTELGEHDQAERALERAISLDSSLADGHYLLGRIARKRNQVDKAIRHFSAAIERDPLQQDAHRDLVMTLLSDKTRHAAPAARQAAEKFPDVAEFWFYLGVAQERAGDVIGAIASYERVCTLQPDAHAAHFNVAGLYARQRKQAEALLHYNQAAQLAPDNPHIALGVGEVYLSMGRREEACATYRRYLALRPDPVLAHTLGWLVNEEAERAPDEYVAVLFDQYANDFDAHLTSVLKYDTPKRLADLIECAWKERNRQYRILDLGCGTGLVGEALGDFAAHLTGVDLSRKMLEKARSRKVYDRLEQANLEAMMSGEADGSYDGVVAADVFIYIGKLDRIVEHAWRILRPSGLLAFSVEAAEPKKGSVETASTTYLLQRNGRYVHTRAYIEALAQEHGFETLVIRQATCRENEGVPVAAYLALFQRLWKGNDAVG